MSKLFKQNIYLILLSIIIIVHAIVLTKLIYFPYSELFIYPYLTNQGLKPYGQILDQHFPGLLFLPINLNNLGMTTPEIARVWSIVVVVIVQLMLFFIGSRILKSKKKALLVNILYLIWQPFFEGWVLWIDSFLPVILLPAFYALYKRWIFRAGLLLGIGIIFKQVLIPLSIFALIYLFWKDRKFKDLLRYSSGLFLPIALMVTYFCGIGVFSDFWYWTVIFNLTVFAKFGRGAAPTQAHLLRVLFVFGSGFLAIKRIKTKEAQILLIFLIGALIGLTTRFDFVHFQPALPFAVLATVYVLEKWSGKLVILGMLGYFLISFWWLITFYKGHLGDRLISFDSQTRNLALKLKKYTVPGEKIFIYGAAPHLYQMTKTLPAGNIFVFQFAWFMQVAEDRILDGIMNDKPKIIIFDKTAEVEGVKLTDFTRKIDKYISQNYQEIDKVGTAQILRKIAP